MSRTKTIRSTIRGPSVIEVVIPLLLEQASLPTVAATAAPSTTALLARWKPVGGERGKLVQFRRNHELFTLLE